jgi:hypothetical protein
MIRCAFSQKRSGAASPQPTLIGFVQNKAPPFCDPFPPTSIFLVSSPLLLLSKANGPLTIGSSLNRFPTDIPDYVYDSQVRSRIPLRRMSPTALPSLDRSSAICHVPCHPLTVPPRPLPFMVSPPGIANGAIPLLFGIGDCTPILFHLIVPYPISNSPPCFVVI